MAESRGENVAELFVVDSVTAADVVWKPTQIPIPQGGLPVNLVVGQTGTGKTSLIQLLAGGFPTCTGGASDTKKPSLYKVVKDGKEVILLDTVGLGDNQSTGDQRSQFLAKMVAYIKQKNLNVCRIYFTVGRGQRVMQEMVDWIPTCMIGLGGLDKCSLISSWIITSWNLDSRVNRVMCQRDMENPTGTRALLMDNQLGFDVVTHGMENDDDIFANFISADSGRRGLAKDGMSTNVEHHKLMKTNCENLEQGMRSLQQTMGNMKTEAEFKAQAVQLQQRLDQAASDLASCGKSEDKKKRYKNLIQDANRQLGECQQAWSSNTATKAQKAAELKALNQNFEIKLVQLQEREGVMSELGSLVGLGAKKMAQLVKAM